MLDRLSDCQAFTIEDCYPEAPRLLGFEAQRVLLEAFAAAETAGEPFDYIAFLEDDILLTDADFFPAALFQRVFWRSVLIDAQPD